MKEQRKLEDITDREIEFYMTVSDFKVGKYFFIILLLAISVGFLMNGLNGIAFAVITVCLLKFIALPLYMHFVGKMTKKSDPKEYREFLDWKKKEYYKKYFS